MILSWQRAARRLRYRLLKNRRPLLVLLLGAFILDALVLLNHRPPTQRIHLGQEQDRATPRVFIVSIHRNTGNILPVWGDAALALVDYLGPDRVFFSAVESGSQDDTKEKLAALKRSLDARGVKNEVSLGKTVWEQLDEMWARPDPDGPRQDGWIWNQEDKLYDLRRITYLAKERNKALQPLWDLEKQGDTFDKILWINDVVFNTEDFVTLLQTRKGKYAAACSMDFRYSSQYYDTFALRDDQGRKTVSNFWPWFLGRASREAARRGEPIPVQSCWNGLVLFDAAPFYGDKPLRFRAIPDSLADLHLEASECCLIHADNPLNNARQVPSAGIWLNPNVRVGYSAAVYEVVQGHQGVAFPGVSATLVGAWVNRWFRWRAAWQQHFEMGTVMRRVRKWQEETPLGHPLRAEPGINCLINEKQIMWMNGWRHL